MTEQYDVVVIGVGGMGSAVLYHLARRGYSVCGIEQYAVGHQEGSSHGDTRIIRKAYPEAADYMPLIDRAYMLWEELEEEGEEELLEQCGFLAAAKKDSDFAYRLENCCETQALLYESWDAAEARRHFPQFTLPEDFRAYFDPLGGFLYAERCISAHARLAVHHGAVLYDHERVSGWQVAGDGVTVETAHRRIRAGRLVITSGPWAMPLLHELNIPAAIWRRCLFWYRPEKAMSYSAPHFPSFVIDVHDTGFYGCPATDLDGVKVGEHNLPRVIETPGQMRQQLADSEREIVARFAETVFPQFPRQVQRHDFCMYSVTPDHHFILDRHPQHRQVILGCGFSGHGFKFAPVIGELLADLAIDGKTALPIDFLGIDRPALQAHMD